MAWWPRCRTGRRAWKKSTLASPAGSFGRNRGPGCWPICGGCVPGRHEPDVEAGNLLAGLPGAPAVLRLDGPGGRERPLPMDRMRPPSVPEQPVPVLTDEQLRSLLASSDGQDFVDRRDTAIIRLFMDTSCRRAEIAGLTTADVSL